MKSLNIYAGHRAMKVIEEKGLCSNLFDTVLGASGGPKWFTLFGLDKYMFGTFFKDRKTPLHIVGSSAGSFRFACFAQCDAVAAISRLADCYSRTIYSDHATPEEITGKAKDLIDYALDENGVNQIVDNELIRTHFIVARAVGLTASENRYIQLAGLATSYLLNYISRTTLKYHYERIVFAQKDSDLKIIDSSSIPTKYAVLTSENLKDALLASGSIPAVMQGVRDIAGVEAGIYRDGGIIDYHFDLSFNYADRGSEEKLVLYPHFVSHPKAGWFDKSLARTPKGKNYDNIVMLVPSAEYVSKLPYQKISDRKDFKDFPPDQRIPYWQTVLRESERLADDFAEFLEKPDLSKLRPIDFD